MNVVHALQYFLGLLSALFIITIHLIASATIKQDNTKKEQRQTHPLKLFQFHCGKYLLLSYLGPVVTASSCACGMGRSTCFA